VSAPDEKVRTGNGYSARCPAHDDEHSSATPGGNTSHSDEEKLRLVLSRLSGVRRAPCPTDEVQDDRPMLSVVKAYDRLATALDLLDIWDETLLDLEPFAAAIGLDLDPIGRNLCLLDCVARMALQQVEEILPPGFGDDPPTS
jgi:hypothetical protein